MPPRPEFFIQKRHGAYVFNVPNSVAQIVYGKNRFRVRSTTKGEAEEKVREVRDALANKTGLARRLTEEQALESMACLDRCAEMGVTLTHVVDAFARTHAAAKKSLSLAELLAEFLAAKQREGGRGSGARHMRDVKEKFGRFAADHPKTLCAAVTPIMVSDWLVGLTTMPAHGVTSIESAPLAPQSRNAYRRILNAVLGYGLRRGYSLTNPVTAVGTAKVTRTRVSLLSPDLTAAMLRAADPTIRPYIAICAFAGLRPDHVKRVRWEQIHFERAEIEVPAGEDKTDVERIVPIQPNLAAWLQASPHRKGTIHWSRKAFRAAWLAIRLSRWPQDCLRHNYGTYRVKLTGNMPLVALEMGNSVEVIKARYYRSVPQAEAESYFNIFPNR